MNRLLLCSLYTPTGIIGSSDLYLIESYKKISTKILIIVNGGLSQKGREQLEARSIEFIERENYGLDFGAWKAGIDHLGIGFLKKYDELIITNCTCFGPIFSLEEMMRSMHDREIDFWGINRHPEQPNVFLISNDKSSFVRQHLQSYFIVFKNKILSSLHFEQYWSSIKLYNTYNEEIAYHEVRLTEYFENFGYTSDSYMPYDKYKTTGENPSLLTAYRQISEDRCPLVKKKVFTLLYDHWINCGQGLQASEVLKFIHQQNPVLHKFILEELFKLLPTSDIQNNLQLTFTLSADKTNYNICDDKEDVALCFFCFYDDLIEYNLNYIKNFNIETRIIILSAKETLLRSYKSSLNECGYKRVEIVHVEPRGRDVSALIVGALPKIISEKYVCVLHDKKTSQAGELMGMEYCRHNFENTVASREYIYNVIQVFDQNPNIGLLYPIHFPYIIGNEMGVDNLGQTKELFEKLELSIPFDKHPTAPFGTMFWMRGNALSHLLQFNFQFEDFPKEPIKNDGTMLHAFERLYSSIAQQNKYLSGWILSDKYASRYLNHMYYYVRSVNSTLFNIYGYLDLIQIKKCLTLLDLKNDSLDIQQIHSSHVFKLLVTLIKRKIKRKFRFE